MPVIDGESDKRIKAFKEFAKLHPSEWESYRGCCSCPSCRDYREQFEKWYRDGMGRLAIRPAGRSESDA